MRFLEYLYFKYYNLSVKLGSKVNASVLADLQSASQEYQHL